MRVFVCVSVCVDCVHACVCRERETLHVCVCVSVCVDGVCACMCVERDCA